MPLVAILLDNLVPERYRYLGQSLIEQDLTFLYRLDKWKSTDSVSVSAYYVSVVYKEPASSEQSIHSIVDATEVNFST